MSSCFRKVSMILVVIACISLTVAWAQNAPAAGSNQAPAPAQSTAPAQSASPNLPSNVRVVPNAKDGNVSSDSLHPKVMERWDTPSLEGSHLAGVGSIELGTTDTFDTYTHEVQRVEWRLGDPIDLYIIRPTGPVVKPPVILYLYSYPFETDRFSDSNFCKFLVRNGVAAVGFPSALTAARYHDRPLKEWFVSQMRESLATSAHDVQKILDYLDKRGDFDMSRVGMFGDGSGATIAILAAAADPRIKTLDLVDPWGDWPDWVAKSTRIPEDERPNFLKKDWLDANAPLDPVKWLPQLKTPNVRIQFVKSVTITPLEAQAKIEAAAPHQAQIVHYDNAAAFQAVAATGKGFDWIKERVLGVAELPLSAISPAKATDSKSESSQR
jgi:hypothetical protein